MQRFSFFIFFILLSICTISAADLVQSLRIVEECDRERKPMPVMFNHHLVGGYFVMPSARMGEVGEVGLGATSAPPYRIYSFRTELAERLELSGNYHIFTNVPDPVLSPHGFGDLYDRGVNVKFSLLKSEESDNILPDIAIGLEDFLGTRSFKSEYIAFTKTFAPFGLEATLGYGMDRIRGFFGGMQWMPFYRDVNPFLKGLCFALEYDATPYEDEHVEKHPEGRVKRSPINGGIKWRFFDMLDLSLGYIRGDAWAFSCSLFYNMGKTHGLFPKFENPRPYLAPRNTEPVGPLRLPEVVVQDFLFAFRVQGFDLLSFDLFWDKCLKQVLRIKLLNLRYQWQEDVRCRLNHVVAALTPSDIDRVIVVIDDDGLPCQEYRYYMPFVREYAHQVLSNAELDAMTPLAEVTEVDRWKILHLFEKRRPSWNFELFPKVGTWLGGARGKFKYFIGVTAAFNGFIYPEIFYSVRFGCPIATDLAHLGDMDMLNPSQIINVRSDAICYSKQKGITLDEAYLQKNWNLSNGLFARLAGGLFEEAYGGVAGEVLYYPVDSDFAFGGEAAFLKKRAYSGWFGFSSKIRKLKGFKPTYCSFTGTQAFANFYYDLKMAELKLKVKVGQFLARDMGARFELMRYFSNGLRLFFWYTLTNGGDVINGKRYHDQGIGFSMPLDIFYTHSERSRWGYSMASWLRDVGVSAKTGKSLYELIEALRY